MCAGGFGVTDVERRVEGYQGDTPFGVTIQPLSYSQYEVYDEAYGAGEHSNGTTSSGFATGTGRSGEYSMRSLTSASSPPGPLTPADELDGNLQHLISK